MLGADGRVGPYRVLELVDRGEHAAVYRVEHVILGTHHALKRLHDGQDEALTRALLASARLQSRLIHPNLVRVTDAGIDQGRPWAVSDWVDGRLLSDWLDARGALPLARALPLFRGVVRGVYALHAQGVVHRDLKPGNVLVEIVAGRAVPRVTDLGLARELRSPDPRSDGLSAAFRLLGTPEYMAPEQGLDPGSVDERADLWSLGVMLYELLTDEVPFEGETEAATMEAARAGGFVPLRERAPDLPAVLDALIDDLLRPDPRARPADCGQILKRLDGLS